MTYKESTIKRMAVLWEQRELLREMVELEPVEAEIHRNGIGSESSRKMCMEGEGVFWLPENLVVDAILKKRGKTFSDHIEVVRIKRVITASVVTDHFLISKRNEDFGNCKKIETVRTSVRLISIDPDKGSELQNNLYFWTKYIASAFPPVTSIVISILTALLTSGVIWYFVLSKLNLYIPH